MRESDREQESLVERVLPADLTVAIDEAAEHRRPIQLTVAAIRRRDVPLPRACVVHAEREPFEVTGSTV